MITIKETQDEITEKAFSFEPLRTNGNLSTVAYNLGHLATLIEGQLTLGDQGLTKAQTKACEEVAKKLLEKLNKSLTRI